MSARRTSITFAGALVCAAAEARADEPSVPPPADLAEALERANERIDVLEERLTTLHERQQQLLPLYRFLTVFVDVGWFSVAGNGSGVRSDHGHRYVRDYDHVPAEWVFLGDPLSTTINSLGEAADLGTSRAIERDTIDSNGNPTFLVNSVGLSISRAITRRIEVAGLVELLPRPGPDELVVELARIDYRPSDAHELTLSAGKIDPVLGIEYRAQDAPARLGITPSLACRYTCGRPIGVRGRFQRGRLELSASVTNGDAFVERFEPELRLASSRLPTLAAHVQWMLPIENGLEVGASGAFGPQDGQPALHVHQWQYGVDLRLRETHGISVQAEYVQGKQQGSSTGLSRAAGDDPTIVAPHCTIAPCLRFRAAYGLARWRIRDWVTPYVRVDWRDARHQSGIEFLYASRVLRGTFGIQFAMTSRVLAKLELVKNHELLGPQFPNDLVTTSVIVSTD